LAAAEKPLAREAIEAYIEPPLTLGEPINDKGVWELLNAVSAPAGFVFEFCLISMVFFTMCM